MLEGELKDGIFVFKGIPYAAHPSGFTLDAAATGKAMGGTRPAKKYGAIAPQNLMPAGGGFGPDFSVNRKTKTVFS